MKGETSRQAPWTAYITLCVCLFISSAASNLSLDYINYPTKVVFRSCKASSLTTLFSMIIIYFLF